MIPLLLALLLALVFALFSCDLPSPTPTPPVCTDHVDTNGDGVCDTPGCYEGLKPNDGKTPSSPSGAELPTIPVEPDEYE